MTLRHKFTHAHAVRAAWGIFATLIVIEACAVFHFYVEQKDVFAATVIVTTWGKEALLGVIEHFLEA